MKVKHTITFKFEDNIDFKDYDPSKTPKENREYYSEWCLDELYGRLDTRAEKILSEYTGVYTIEYEDGKKYKYLTE